MTASVRVRAKRRFGTLSPLRYPGGKAALAGLFADVISELRISNCTYVEPYAGGAGAGITLLRKGLVSRLVINDIDPAVYAFWLTSVKRNDAFVDWIESVPLTIAEWRRQRETYRDRTASIDELGRAFFYLNRTNRSGVLNAGVIGGQAQTGNFKIDARFNRETLSARIRAIGAHSEAIEVTALDGRTVIEQHRRRRTSFLYVDPPYVQAGSQLYLNSFEARDHLALADSIGRIDRARWLLTYDLSPFVERMYSRYFNATLDLNYSARYPGRASELLVASHEVGQVIMSIAANTVAEGA